MFGDDKGEQSILQSRSTGCHAFRFGDMCIPFAGAYSITMNVATIVVVSSSL
jgi:hypothetical protein